MIAMVLLLFYSSIVKNTFCRAFRTHPRNIYRRRCFLSTTFETSARASEVDQAEQVKVPRRFVPFPFQYHHELEMHVETLTNLGVGIGRVNLQDTVSAADSDNINMLYLKEESNNRNRSSSAAIAARKRKQEEKEEKNMLLVPDEESNKKKWVIMVPDVIPGEFVRVRIYRNHKSYSEADLIEIVQPSPHRIKPKCVLFEVCGGCQYQHMPIHLQRFYKQQQVQQLLQRANIPSTTVLPTIGTEEEYYYRSKITPHYDAPTTEGSIGPIGFNKKNVSQRAVVDVQHCVIATRAINEKLITVRRELHEKQSLNIGAQKKRKGATLLLRQHGDDEEVTTDPNQLVFTTVNNLKLSYMAGNFFQNNPHVLPLMVQCVVEGATYSSSNNKKMTHLIDCYCGSGLFCLSASSNFEICVGIEVNERAIEEARYNAELNTISNCAFIAASAEAIFESNNLVSSSGGGDMNYCVRDFPRETTVVVLDPPRKGCSSDFLNQLYKFSPQRVVYMSCDPATQARDTKGLISNGYSIVSVQPFDLFPQTRHIECLIIFDRQENPTQDDS